MIVKDITNYEPSIGDILQLECGDTLVEVNISDITDDGYVVEIVNEGVFDFLKQRAEQHAGNTAMESLGYIFGIVASSSEGWTVITNVLKDEEKIKLQRAIDQLKTDPNWIDNQALKKGMRDGINDARSNKSDIDEMIRAKFSKISNSMDFLNIKESTEMSEAEYQGRKVPLGKPMKGDVKKSKVYVKGPKGNVVKVNFGDKNMRIKKSNPNRRKSFRARHNCDNPGPRWRARYWSCRAW